MKASDSDRDPPELIIKLEFYSKGPGQIKAYRKCLFMLTRLYNVTVVYITLGLLTGLHWNKLAICICCNQILLALLFSLVGPMRLISKRGLLDFSNQV